MSDKHIKDDNKNSGDGVSAGADAPFSSLEEEKMREIGRAAARVRSMEGDFEILPQGSKIYFVAKDWESSMIKDDPVIETVTTLQELRDALCEAEINTIFIPEGALVSLPQIRKICGEYAVSKVIYMEGDGETT